MPGTLWMQWHGSACHGQGVSVRQVSTWDMSFFKTFLIAAALALSLQGILQFEGPTSACLGTLACGTCSGSSELASDSGACPGWKQGDISAHGDG